MKRIRWSLIFVLAVCNFSCETVAKNQTPLISLTMERRLSVGPCFAYKVIIDSNGKSSAEKNCQRQIDPSQCNNYESNGISTEKRPCFKDEVEKLEKQLNSNEVKELINEIEKSYFFTFEDDYSQSSKNCLPPPTDLSTTLLTIKFNERMKTIEHYKGCFVEQVFSKKDALQPLTDLENRIDEIVGTNQWIGERK